jgi:predicted PurR-regulated permease PerM
MAPQPTMRERLHRVNEAREALRRRVQEARESADADDAFTTGTDTIVMIGDGSTGPERGIPDPVRSAAAWAWRFLLIIAAVVVAAYALWQVRLIVFPVVAALLVSALLYPAVRRLRTWGVGRALSAALVFVGGLVVIAGVFTLLTQLLTDQFGDISVNLQDGIDEVRSWLANGPLDLSETQIDQTLDDITKAVSDNRDILAGGAIATATAALEILTGTLLALFTTYFFLYDGQRIWNWCVGLFPRSAERSVAEAGRRAWRVLTSYVRATIIIAAVDAVGIGLVLVFVGIPLAVPLGVLVFFGSFIPIVGATVTGAVAVLVALVTNGAVAALIVLAGVIAIQQLEGHILQPLIMGRFVRIHPLAVVLSVAVGGVVAGIGGTVVAVPLVAVLNVVFQYFSSLHRTQPAVEADPAAEETPVDETGAPATGSRPATSADPAGAPQS